MRNNLNLSQLICELQGRLDQEAASTPTNATDVVRRDEPMRHLEIQICTPEDALARDKLNVVLADLERLLGVTKAMYASEWPKASDVIESRIQKAIDELTSI